ncbi:SDR family NAD(P)-dependent oxidoreductase [Bdellovibrio bacteriovorus]|uniref:SDR family NAD(P)-dependent oxidoreductase n=1 Tax=Bdellovibrio bacteriovorus TaxID=959 RepID=UPI0035A66364
MSQVWGIIGLGWLGAEFANYLTEKNQKYWGTHRSSFSWEKDFFPDEFCDVLLINVPPLKTLSPSDFVGKIPENSFKKIIFVSSISVYGDVSGEVTEATEPRPNSESGQWLYAVEQALQKRYSEKCVIVRAGGLIGGSRHPVFQIAGRGLVQHGLAPVNLIHREDLIRIIYDLGEGTTVVPRVNAVTPFHPSKESYYSVMAAKRGLPPIKFEQSGGDGKIVSSEVLSHLYPEWICAKLDRL